MIFEGATNDDLKERGIQVKAIIVESIERGTPFTATTENKEISSNVFLEDEKGKRFQIAERVDFLDIEGLTKNNDIYYLNLTMIEGGKLYISDKILYLETIEERFKTLTILIPIY
jgi:hypothetical protein